MTPAMTERVTQLLITSCCAMLSAVGMTTGAYTFGGGLGERRCGGTGGCV